MYQSVCKLDDIYPNSGVAVLVENQQIALFRVQAAEGEQIFAIDNYDPFSKANVLSRGLVGSLKNRTVVASPIYKQHFCLQSGVCLEDETIKVNVWSVKLEQDQIMVAVKQAVAA